MCGIAGIYAYLAVAPKVDRAELARMNARMAPRGPDGSGLWLSAGGRTGLAHQRLAIIEAMKMEHTLVSPLDGVVAEIAVAQDAQVGEGAKVMVIAPCSSPSEVLV